MADNVLMPKLGFDMKEGTLVRWVKLEGEKIQKGDVIAEIETDKATVEVESGFTGVLLKHLVEADSIVPIGDSIAIIGKEGEKVDVDSKSAISTPVKNKKSEQIMDQKKDKSTQVSDDELSTDDDRLKASPLARKMAADLQLDLAQISGSGPGGRIIKRDLDKINSQDMTDVVVERARKPTDTGKEDQVVDQGISLNTWNQTVVKLDDKKIPLNRLRQAISRRMSDSKQQIPHFYETYVYDVESLMEIRELANLTLPDDQKLSINDFIIKAVATVLKNFPNLNASINEKEINQYASVNIGVAVSIEGGLLTVVVRDADLKPIRLISKEVKEMASRVREGKIKPEDVEGSTFSISNLGMYGVEQFTAIINPPEAAILAVAAAKQVPVVKNGDLAIGWRMSVTISADHRITDGVEAAKFLKALAFELENPIRLLL